MREDSYILWRSPVKGKPSRYAVEYVSIIDPKDRAEWIASATINIYDMETDVLMASKTWYAFETGFGLGGQRMPWLEAISCPDRKGHDIRFLLTKLSNPNKEIMKCQKKNKPKYPVLPHYWKWPIYKLRQKPLIVKAPKTVTTRRSKAGFCPLLTLFRRVVSLFFRRFGYRFSTGGCYVAVCSTASAHAK